MKIKYRRSTWITVALLIYVTATAIYLLPHNLMETSKERIYTLIASYVIVVLLCLILRKKENAHKQKENDNNTNQLKQ
jgi:uncharacterized membrane protein